MKSCKRSIRRHHIDRLKQARKHYWGYGYPEYQSKFYTNVPAYVGLRGLREMSPVQLGRVVQNPQMCSCGGCGNQGKYEGKKTQYKAFDEVLKTLYNDEENWDANVPEVVDAGTDRV